MLKAELNEVWDPDEQEMRKLLAQRIYDLQNYCSQLLQENSDIYQHFCTVSSVQARSPNGFLQSAQLTLDLTQRRNDALITQSQTCQVLDNVEVQTLSQVDELRRKAEMFETRSVRYESEKQDMTDIQQLETERERREAEFRIAYEQSLRVAAEIHCSQVESKNAELTCLLNQYASTGAISGERSD